MSAETDNALMLAVRDGHLAGMAALFERHHRRMYRFFRRSVRDSGTCEDLVQNLFVRMIERRATYRGEAAFTSWMYRIAIRMLADHVRAARTGHLPLESEILGAAEATGAGDGAAIERRRLAAAFAALRPAERDVLTLTRLEELSLSEAAAVLGCSIGAVKVRVHRALIALRRRCAERGGPA